MIKTAICLWLVINCCIICNADAEFFIKHNTNVDIGQYYKGIIGNCQLKTCPNQFNCKCQSLYTTTDSECIAYTSVCDGIADCSDGSDEIDCRCSDDQFQCGYCDPFRECDMTTLLFNPYRCIRSTQADDGVIDCLNVKDEISDNHHCARGNLYCNGIIECPFLKPHDESKCSGCPPDRPTPCECYKKETNCSGGGKVCFSEQEKCNGIVDCIDGSDEVNCECSEGEFQCRCYTSDPIACIENRAGQCIALDKYHDGKEDCPDRSDETQYINTLLCSNCSVTVLRLHNIQECNKIDNVGVVLGDVVLNSCDESSCFESPSLKCSTSDCNQVDVLCTSRQKCTQNSLCRNPFQCNDGSLLLANNFCDDKFDCPDHSDEIKGGAGFKCPGDLNVCTLPQRNLYDNISQCKDGSDFNCRDNCFQCLDNRLLISSKQVCDGTIDCYDFSDECLCEDNFENDICSSVFPAINSTNLECYSRRHISEETLEHFSPSIIRCRAKETNNKKYYFATLCDDRPECRDYSDECDCENPPAFCNDLCHIFYPIGDRYCDGIEDEAWKLINKPDCPKGFDEMNCPKRFRCKAGKKVSVDIVRRCDNKKDCDNGEDEEGCTQTTNLFSSDEEMIANKGLKACFWIMSLAVIAGNSYVIITSGLYFKNTKDGKGSKLQRLIILNISIADMIMGIYLLIISFFSVKYSENYRQVDLEWRSSLRCSVIGSFTIISSESSCLMMVLLATFRFEQFRRPFAARTMATRPWKVAILLVWLIAGAFGIFPICLDYFVNEVWFTFLQSSTWKKISLTKFACRLAQLTNKTINNKGADWKSVKTFLANNFPKYAPQGEIGYYGETSVCMPRFYPTTEDNAWQYTLVVITINFISFIYIAISYVYIYKKVTSRQEELQTQMASRRDKETQRRIARIIVTDFCCWIPICITCYAKISGHPVSNEVYVISAALLLPINSALNPVLFSPLFETMHKKLFRRVRNDNA